MRHLNLVFQGGGVKGIAYAGVLSAKPAGYNIEAVAGTSAGAIAAAFVALGYDGDELKEVLSDKLLFELLSKEEQARAKRMTAAWTDIQSILLDSANAGKKPSAMRLWRLWRTHKRTLSDLRDVWDAQGLHSTSELRRWLNDKLKGAVFGDIVTDELKIVAADVSKQRFRVFDKRGYAEMPIAAAVQASASIPVFFIPFVTNADSEYLVDGGILSNFPSFLFAQSKYPTVGFRFADMSQPDNIVSTWDYLKSLLFTMTGAHDKFRRDPPHFVAHEIRAEISSTKFDLSREEVDALYEVGRKVGKQVDWKKHSSEREIVSFYDERPDDVLEVSLAHAYKLLEQYQTNRDLWVAGLDATCLFTVWIEADWSVRYDTREFLKLRGPKPLFFSGFIAGWNPGVRFGRSLADLDYVINEVKDGRELEQIRVPALNSETQKGFVVFYTPPLADDGTTREFHTAFSVPKELSSTLGKGRSDVLGYSTRQIAHDHMVQLTFRILIDTDVNVACRAAFDAPESALKAGEVAGREGRTYKGWQWKIPNAAVKDKLERIVHINAGGS